jgi:Holliday junction resolvase RusA-like endonuclease
MIAMYFRIENRLPSMNEVIAANRTNKYVGAKIKREAEDIIGQYIRIARLKGTIKPTREPVEIEIEWHERTKKRDCDNIQSAQKFVLDALQKQGILINDNRRYVRQIYSKIIDDTADFVEVTLREVK